MPIKLDARWRGLLALSSVLILLVGCTTGVAVPAPGAGPRAFTIKASDYWTDSRVDLVKGQRFSITATGQWTDLHYAADANGYVRDDMRRYERFRRYRTAPWFALIGCIEKSRDNCFLIGKALTDFPAPASGRLYLFANDVTGFYFNNSGIMTVSVETSPAK